MKAARRQNDQPDSNLLFKSVKAALAACVLAVAFIFLLALLLKWEVLNEDAIPLTNTLIKLLGSAFCGLLCAHTCTKNAWLFAGISGVLFILICFLSFSVIERVFSLSLALLSDLALGFFTAMLSGMLLKVCKG